MEYMEGQIRPGAFSSPNDAELTRYSSRYESAVIGYADRLCRNPGQMEDDIT